MHIDIHPQVGVGELRFGMDRERIRSLIGYPSEVSETDFGSGDTSEYWYYEASSLRVDFASNEDWRVDGFSVDSGPVLGVDLFGMGIAEGVTALMEIAGLDFILDEDFPDYELAAYSCDSVGLMAWAREGKFYGMDLLPKYDEDGDNILWPVEEAG